MTVIVVVLNDSNFVSLSDDQDGLMMMMVVVVVVVVVPVVLVVVLVILVKDIQGNIRGRPVVSHSLVQGLHTGKYPRPPSGEPFSGSGAPYREISEAAQW